MYNNFISQFNAQTYSSVMVFTRYLNVHLY